MKLIYFSVVGQGYVIFGGSEKKLLHLIVIIGCVEVIHDYLESIEIPAACFHCQSLCRLFTLQFRQERVLMSPLSPHSQRIGLFNAAKLLWRAYPAMILDILSQHIHLSKQSSFSSSHFYMGHITHDFMGAEACIRASRGCCWCDRHCLGCFGYGRC